MRRLGQHFLKNKSAIKTIINALDPKRGDTIIEIGAGHGELTGRLKAESGESKIIAIEKDRELAKRLQKKFSAVENTEVAEGDALKILPALVKNRGLRTGDWKLAGNIPYYITGRLLRVVSELNNKPQLCVLTVQKEVAERLVAQPPKMNRLAASIQFWAMPKILTIVPGRDFEPPPKVDSAIVKLETKKLLKRGKRTTGQAKSQIKASEYYRTVRSLFAQPRKTILNNLSAIEGIKTKEDVSEKLKKIGLAPSLRPQELSIEDIADIARALR